MEKLGSYFENKLFIEKIFEATEVSEAWLDQYEADHPGEREVIALARRIVSRFRTKEKASTEKEKLIIFSRIIHEIERRRKRPAIMNMATPFLKYAAVALLFFGVGALVFHKKDRISHEFYTSSLSDATGGTDAKLIRSDGRDIRISPTNSDIVHGADGQLQINDQVVSNTHETGRKGVVAYNQLVIPYGKTSRITLSDGSRIFLNAGSRLIYPDTFNGNTREVLLTGEAFLEVTHDPKRPFIVQTSNLKIKVLGTRFNVSAYASDNFTEAVLVEGKISVGMNDAGIFDKPVEISPGQMASFNRSTSRIQLREVNVDDYILWKDGVFRFESLHLNRILKRLERYYNVRFFFSDALLGTLVISGKLELKEDLGQTLDRIARAAHVKITKTGEETYEVKK
ncbi:MAG: FecR family protein [Bacteroidota bacterium]